MNNNNNNIINNNNNNNNNDDDDNKKKSFKNFALVPIMIVVWYSTAIVSITSSKKIMNIIKLPFMLCTSQFLLAYLITSLITPSASASTSTSTPTSSSSLLSSLSSYISKYTNHNITSSSSKPLSKNAYNIIYRIAILYTLGFIFTNISFSIVTASFAETVKSAEPFSTTFLGYFLYKENTSILTYISLIPIVTGVSISCIDDLSFNIYGFLSASISNFCFSGRAVLTKHLYRKYPNCIDEITMFSIISKIGLILLIPLMILLESNSIISLFYEKSSNIIEILLLLFINGIAYSTYNITSFLVLSRTNLITHSVFNCFRRVFIILFTCYYFQVTLSLLNITGVAIAVIGVLFFAYSKHKDNIIHK